MQIPLDILIFGGQSNMQGQTEAPPIPNEPVDGASEYRYLKDSLIPLQHPVGELIGNSLLLGADKGHGSMLPDFCKAYCKASGHRVVAIHAARGGTTISEWLSGTARYEASVKKILAGIHKCKATGPVNKIYYIWLQGESDAIARTSTEAYMQMLTAYKDDLKHTVGIDKFCLIEVGYFSGTVTWLKDRTQEEGIAFDEAIMQAQESLPSKDSDFVLLTQICKTLSRDKININPYVQGHYNNSAMALIGEEAGKALALL